MQQISNKRISNHETCPRPGMSGMRLVRTAVAVMLDITDYSLMPMVAAPC
jgi:hypothetical protein